MNISDELRRVADLRREGYLTEEEFAEAKRQILCLGNGETKPPIAGPNEETTFELDQVEETIYYASRMTSGNVFFPDEVVLESDGIVYLKRGLFGSRAEHINYRAIASFRVTHGIFFSTITIETTGGSQPIVVNGLWKEDAKELQEILREHQTQARHL